MDDGVRYFTDEFHKLVEAIIWGTSWAGIWDLSCSSLFFGLRAADGGAGDWGSFGSWRNSQTRIIIRLLLSHSRQTTDLQWAIIWAIIEQECHADSGNLGVRNGWLTDLHPFVRGLIKQASTFHVHRFHGAPSQLFTGKHASSLLDFSFLSSSLDQHPSSSCRALDQRTHYLDGPPVSLHLYCVLRWRRCKQCGRARKRLYDRSIYVMGGWLQYIRAWDYHIITLFQIN